MDQLGYSDEDETCEMCIARPTFGLAHVSDKRAFGGVVDAKGIRHDPMLHEDGCPLSKPI